MSTPPFSIVYKVDTYFKRPFTQSRDVPLICLIVVFNFCTVRLCKILLLVYTCTLSTYTLHLCDSIHRCGVVDNLYNEKLLKTRMTNKFIFYENTIAIITQTIFRYIVKSISFDI